MATVKTVTVNSSRFGFDGDDAVFTAHGAGPNWNGWFVPIVDHETLVAVVVRMNERDIERTTELVDLTAGVVVLYEFEWDHEGRVLVNESVITPDVDGNYLLDVGLTLVALDEACAH
ncbi:MAG: hypothetical protein QOG75_5966 [Mycobacterium sp.]|jgi:hypothetical protein|nr:hypothetical protein [Mycobacterium sp.]